MINQVFINNVVKLDSYSFIGVGNRFAFYTRFIGTQEFKNNRDLHPCKYKQFKEDKVTI